MRMYNHIAEEIQWKILLFSSNDPIKQENNSKCQNLYLANAKHQLVDTEVGTVYIRA